MVGAKKRKGLESSGGPEEKSSIGATLLMVLSPAKSLDLSEDYSLHGLKVTSPCFEATFTREIANVMKSHAKAGRIKQLLGLSPNLTTTATKYWNNFAVDGRGETTKPCIFAFSGAAYQGLQVKTMDKEALDNLQQKLRIIDPVYGLLKPLDVIQPYRLEMATKDIFTKGKNLTHFWKEPIKESLDSFKTPVVILNLASDEYWAAMGNDLPANVTAVKVLFRHGGRVIAIHAKRARGLMARYVAENNVQNVNDVKSFAEEGYSFNAGESSDTTFVFDRKDTKKQRKR